MRKNVDIYIIFREDTAPKQLTNHNTGNHGPDETEYLSGGLCGRQDLPYISNVNFTSKISIPPEPVFKNMGQQMSGPDSSIGWSIRHESEGWGFESLSGRDIFCLKNFDTFTRTPVRVPKMNAVDHAQLTFQMLTLLQKYITKMK